MLRRQLESSKAIEPTDPPSGQVFVCNFGRAVEATFIGIIGFLAERMPLNWVRGALSLGGYAFAVIAVLRLPETRGKVLNEA